MFDTSVVHARAIAAPRGVTLFASIAIHSIAIIAVVALTLTSTKVPTAPPKQFALYRPFEVPSSPPAPPGLRRSVAPPASAARAAAVSGATQQVAPAQIPDQIPIAAASTSLAPAATDTADAAFGEPDGDPNGVPGGVTNGQPGGTGVVEQHGPFTPGVSGVTAARVLTKVEPQFPNALRGAVTSTTVVVHCVIGKDGRIHDPEIIKSSFAPFNDAVLAALAQWRFAPGMMNGQPVDTYFMLTVNFEIRR